MEEYPDITIAVRNVGKVNWNLLYDGKTYNYPVGKVVFVPYKIARFHFGVEYRNGHLVWDRREKDDKGEETRFHNRLASYEPKGLMDYGNNRYADMAEYMKWRDSFRNGLEFGIQPRSNTVSPEVFEKFRQVELVDS